ncbi:ParB N-terminal domain-containing protein [Ponticoccus gilvus]|nr:ParB N-terminal domain-containing protein [Enemella evansiae]
MAKRKRLTPPREDYIAGTAAAPRPGLGAGASPPISHIAGDAAASSALREVAEEMSEARADGRFLLRLPLDQVDAGWLMRDRLGNDGEAQESLRESLRRHGQRTPVEVAELGGGRYGLISGWRRLHALRSLYDETGEARFATVLALPRRPDSAEDAYVAMIEENEIRLGLSYFERARIAAKSVETGVFGTEKEALQKLYASASRAKRSKIGSFLRIYHALQDALSFAPDLPERLGLALVKALDTDPDLAPRIAEALRAAPPRDAAAEQALLQSLIAGPRAPASPKPAPQREALTPGLTLEAQPAGAGRGRGRIVLEGADVTPALLADLRDWLAAC